MDIRKRVLPVGWYPGSAEETREEIKSFDRYIRRFTPPSGLPFGGVAPHAGWYFSGRLAALVFHLCSAGEPPDVVAVIGGHMGGGRGVIYADQAWDTPLGRLEIDRELTEALIAESGIQPEGAMTNDNTVEVQLPLVRYYFPYSRLLAFRAPHSEKAAALGRLLASEARNQGKTIKVFGSTDLTHYGPNYGFSPRGHGESALDWVRQENDRGFIEQALAMNEAGMLGHAAEHLSACSAGAAAAASAACRELGADRGELLDYYTSADIMPGDSFVGYAGIIYEKAR